MARIHCVIEGCRCSVSGETFTKRWGAPAAEAEYICQRHWKMAPAQMKRVYARHQRRDRRAGIRLIPHATDRIWTRIKRAIVASIVSGKLL